MCEQNESYRILLNKARNAMRDGRNAWGKQSTFEKVAVALILDREDWFEEFGYTLAEAIECIGQERAAMIPQIARQIASEEI
jgi:hypothetical protein